VVVRVPVLRVAPAALAGAVVRAELDALLAGVRRLPEPLEVGQLAQPLREGLRGQHGQERARDEGTGHGVHGAAPYPAAPAPRLFAGASRRVRAFGLSPFPRKTLRQGEYSTPTDLLSSARGPHEPRTLGTKPLMTDRFATGDRSDEHGQVPQEQPPMPRRRL